jgi:hypothetical protein
MADPQKILISGATGLVGRALCEALKLRGHKVRALSRSRGDFRWDVDAGTMDSGALDGVDCVVHLAGEPVAQRWTDEAKQRILQSRTRSTELLVAEILKQAKPPAFISASGINYYGYDCNALVDENSESGGGFLAEVCRQWEGAAQPLFDAGIRTVFMRTGIVLSAEGGALAKMLPPFKMGVGGRIGSGLQKMSWISLADLVAAYVFAIEHEELSGPINAVAPESVTNTVFTKTLGKVLGRPTIFPLPATVVKSLFGEMGTETVLANVGVLPTRLQSYDFEWKTPTLEEALRAAIQKIR